MAASGLASLSVALLALLLAPCAMAVTKEGFREILLETARGPTATAIVDVIKASEDFSLREADDLVECGACVAALQFGVDTVNGQGVTQEELFDWAKQVCYQLDVLSQEGCDGIVDGYGPILWYIYIEAATPVENFCAVYLGPKCEPLAVMDDWVVDVDQDKPDLQDPFIPEPDLLPTQTVLHLSDIHLDLSYTQGNLASQCEDELCCTSRAGEATGDLSDDAADYWGEYTCDLPEWTFRNMLEQIHETHTDISMIIFTGDLPAHDIYYQSREANLEAIETAFGHIADVFGLDVPLFAAVGNHEIYPCNGYPTADVPSEFDPSWLYGGMADLFSSWLPSDAADSLSLFGYYSVLVQPEFRIIAINTNTCADINFWLGYEYVDPLNQLSWMADELQKAEDAGERVWILGHQASGNGGCLGNWAREFTKIINRYEGTISNIFYGHTHSDQFMLFYDEEDPSRATSVALIAPSVTSHKDNNPSYRIMTVDGNYGGSTRRVMNFVNYLTDLSEAVEGQDPEYVSFYNAIDDLELEHLLPADFDAMVYKLRDDDVFFDNYYNIYSSGVDYKADAWTEDERRSVICDSVTSNREDKTKCDEIMG